MRARVGAAIGCLLLSPVFGAEPRKAVEAELEVIELPASAVRIGLEDPIVIDALLRDSDEVCERYVPTGSRISAQRCTLKSAPSAAEQKQLRQDIDQMRRLQMDRELAQQRAIAAMMQMMRRAAIQQPASR